MARHPLEDFLQAFPFWLADIGPIDTLGIPILNPLLGFASITAPEITVEQEEFKEGNFPFSRKVVKSASVSTLTMTRGKTWYDSDFWAWIMNAVLGRTEAYSNIPILGSIPGIPTGNLSYRRTLMLVHFFRGTETLGLKGAGRETVGAGTRSLLQGIGVGAASGAAAGITGGGGTLALDAGVGALGIEAFEFAARLPAMLYLLYNCIPVRYKTTSDFDASSGEVSIQELDVSVEYFEELSAGP